MTGEQLRKLPGSPGDDGAGEVEHAGTIRRSVQPCDHRAHFDISQQAMSPHLHVLAGTHRDRYIGSQRTQGSIWRGPPAIGTV